MGWTLRGLIKMTEVMEVTHVCFFFFQGKGQFNPSGAMTHPGFLPVRQQEQRLPPGPHHRNGSFRLVKVEMTKLQYLYH